LRRAMRRTYRLSWRPFIFDASPFGLLSHDDTI
jgi:hypothetical protein